MLKLAFNFYEMDPCRCLFRPSPDFFLQDNNDKPRSSDPTAFDKGKIPEEEFEQNDDSITIPELKKMMTPWNKATI